MLTAAVLCAALAGCSTGAAEPGPTGGSGAADSWNEPAASVHAPLRGTVVSADDLDHPSFAAKIDNHPAARPQLALNRADIVFEQLVEGGLTRYLAVWHSDVPDQLGPVRSGRPMDPAIVSPFRGILAYAGGQPYVLELLQQAPVKNVIFGMGGDGDLLQRTDDRRSPHNVLAQAAKIVENNADLDAPDPWAAYASDTAGSSAVKEGAEQEVLRMTFSDSQRRSWRYDDASGSYHRTQNGDADVDTDDKPHAATNVVILEVDVVFAEHPTTQLEGKGKAWFSAGGRTVSGQWSKKDRDSGLRFTDENGVSVRLAPGTTWVELVPAAASGGSIQVSGGGD